MTSKRLLTFATVLVIGQGCFCAASAQDTDEVGAITARVHGTFEDKTGGLGVLSGDMIVSGFEVRNGTLTAIGKIVGSLADSSGNVLGQVRHELALPVGNVASTCNQLRMDLAATDAAVLETLVHFDAEVAGFDSRDGSTPKALGPLCAVGELLRSKPASASVADALNGVAAAIRPGRSHARRISAMTESTLEWEWSPPGLDRAVATAHLVPRVGAQGAYDTPPVLTATVLLGAAGVKGAHYQIADAVRTDQYFHQFTLSSTYGSFEAIGRSQLTVRIQEIAALAALDDVSKTEVLPLGSGAVGCQRGQRGGCGGDQPRGDGEGAGLGHQALWRQSGATDRARRGLGHRRHVR